MGTDQHIRKRGSQIGFHVPKSSAKCCWGFREHPTRLRVLHVSMVVHGKPCNERGAALAEISR